MNDDWDVPLAPEDWVHLLDSLVEGLPHHARRLGITPEMAALLRQQREAFRTARHGAMEEKRAELHGRLLAHAPEARWPMALREAFARLMITREPDRTRLIEIIEAWVGGVERAHGGELRVKVRPEFWAEGIDLVMERPRLCDMVNIYSRVKGKAAWQLQCIDTQTRHRMLTSPQEGEEPGENWRGKTMQFVAVGAMEFQLIGWPGEIVEVVVPTEYPVPGTTA
jgi:hypothetical protein